MEQNKKVGKEELPTKEDKKKEFQKEFLQLAEPESASILKQIRCPTNAKPVYNNHSSIPFIVQTLIPEALGYVTGSLFTGRGQKDAKNLLNRFGFTGSHDERVTGHNYFYKTNTNCPDDSENKCSGKPRYVYLRNVPTMSQKGIVSGGLLEDGKDLVATDAMNAFYYGRTKFAGKCKLRKLPVGSALDNRSKQFGNRNGFLKSAEKCLQSTCSNLSGNVKANCEKDCLMGHWIESHCVSDPQKYNYNNVEHFGDKREKDENSINKTFSNNVRDIKDMRDNKSNLYFLLRTLFVFSFVVFILGILLIIFSYFQVTVFF